MSIRVGSSWRTGPGRRSFVSYPLWFLVLCIAFGWPILLLFALARTGYLMCKGAVLAVPVIVRDVREIAAVIRGWHEGTAEMA
jgi:hypothetical protein